MNSQLSEAAKRDRRKLRKTYERAHVLFLDNLEIAPTPENYPLPYALCEKARETRWPRMQFANLMVSDDLSETINQLNVWCEWLMDLSVWATVLDQMDERDVWTVQHTYVDPLAHVCLTQPSAVRDRFGHIATNATHQANLNTVVGYKDKLEQDDEKYPLSRKRVEKQLQEIGKLWEGSAAFIAALQNLDSKDYRRATWNYRNLAAHAIAPRFRLGITNFVVRGMTASSEMVPQPDGTSLMVDRPQKKVVSYGFGGTEALQLREVHALSLGEFRKAVDVFTTYSALIEEALVVLQNKGG